MLGNPKVVAALALAIIATPPVVNAILLKAIEQADTDWLRDIDFNPPPDAQPPENARGQFRPGDRQVPLPNQPTPSTPPPPPCTPQPRDNSGQAIGGPVAVPPTGSMSYQTQRGDLAVVFRIDGSDVTGQPKFSLVEDGAEQWAHAGETHVRERVQLGNDTAFLRPSPGAAWVLRWDLSGTSFTSFAFALTAMACPGAR